LIHFDVLSADIDYRRQVEFVGNIGTTLKELIGRVNAGRPASSVELLREVGSNAPRSRRKLRSLTASCSIVARAIFGPFNPSRNNMDVANIRAIRIITCCFPKGSVAR
jgi:hypothetical protein